MWHKHNLFAAKIRYTPEEIRKSIHGNLFVALSLLQNLLPCVNQIVVLITKFYVKL